MSTASPNRPGHFEIHASDPERAVAFYSAVFGWSISKWDGPWPYWLVGTGEGAPGMDGGILVRRGDPPVEGQPVNSWVVTVNVPSCADAVQAITAAGGTIAHPTMAIPGVGWLAYGKDTEGNIFGVMQSDRNAA